MGVTESTQAKLVHVNTRVVSKCDCLASFSGVQSNQSKQRTDLRPSSQIYKNEYRDRLVSIFSSITALKRVNADEAIGCEEKAAELINGQKNADIKLKRNDRVMSIGAVNTALKLVVVSGGWVMLFLCHKCNKH